MHLVQGKHRGDDGSLSPIWLYAPGDYLSGVHCRILFPDALDNEHLALAGFETLLCLSGVDYGGDWPALSLDRLVWRVGRSGGWRNHPRNHVCGYFGLSVSALHTIA